MNNAYTVKKTVKDTIKKHDMLRNIRHVVLGFSGGPDSMCLFDVLNELAGEMGFTLHPVHVNHGIRKGVCDDEEKFCQEFCEFRGLDLRVFSFDCEEKAKEWGVSTEEAGRKYRYEAFGKVALDILKSPDDRVGKNDARGSEANSIGISDASGNVAIAVAHNSDDQVETVLMRIIRGTGVDGLAGIPYVRALPLNRDGSESGGGNNGNIEGPINIIRPLLDVSRDEILKYCEDQGLNPRMDETNEEPIYRRNKIRLELIPELRKYNPSIRSGILRLAASAEEERNYLEKAALNLYESAIVAEKGSLDASEDAPDKEGQILLNREVLLSHDKSVRKRVIAIALKEMGLREDMVSDHYTACENVILGESPSGEVELPHGFFVSREYENILIGKKKNGESVIEPEFSIREMPISEYREYCERRKHCIENPDKSGTEGHISSYAAFDGDKLRNELGDPASNIQVRTRRPGDIIKLSGGTRKLQDIMVDDKIPKKERNRVQVAAAGSRVLWMVPLQGGKMRWTSEFKIGDETVQVILIEKIENR